ncbi:MAG: 3-isopropylmalate dehydratase small subunit [Thermosulfidibacteraceae bacterium]|jgi:3-isopropylmalate/(R)-2-methylmalate dehydratase small subunit
MKIRGRVWKFGNHVDTDVIIPARYMNTSDPHELAKHCMEDIDVEFVKKVSKGDIIVAGENFGCGSSREHAPIAIKYTGVSAVVAKSFARIFYRNAFNIGLPVIEAPNAVDRIDEGDEIEIDLEGGKIRNITKDEEYSFVPIPGFMMDIIRAGGLIEYAKKNMI